MNHVISSPKPFFLYVLFDFLLVIKFRSCEGIVFNKKKKIKKIALASGVFDLLHFGHIKYLEEAKIATGENTKLIVIVARDKTIQKIKGKNPIIPENQRRALVESLKVVDEAVLGYENFNMEKVIEKIKPDVIAIGYDQEDLEKKIIDYAKKKGLDLKVIRVGKFGEDKLDSSSKIKQKIIKNYK